MSDFDEVMTLFPDHAPSAWAQVQAQLDLEGATGDAVGQAKLAFGTQLKALATQFGAQIDEAAPAAADYVKAGFTVWGAANHVAGLVAGATSEPPAQLVQTSIGVLVGLMAATGAVTAGVGAAIVGVVGVLFDVLQKAGLFGSPPGVSIPGCPGMSFNPAPDQMIGCVARYGQPIASAMLGTGQPNPLWQRFPNQNRQSDAAWFEEWGTSARKIDVAFPEYRYLECQESQLLRPPVGMAAVQAQIRTSMGGYFVSAQADFQRAYFAAWKINQERLLNGQKAASDAEVLYHVAVAWNRAHPSAGADDWIIRHVDRPSWVIATSTSAPASSPFQSSFTPQTARLTPCPSNLPPYVASLIQDMMGQNLTDRQVWAPDGSGLLVHTGTRPQPAAAAPPPAPKRVINLKGLNLKPAGAPPGSFTQPPPTKPIVYQAPPASGQAHTTYIAPTAAHNRPSLWHVVVPFVPVAVGVAFLPTAGLIAPAVGGTISVLWTLLRKSA